MPNPVDHTKDWIRVQMGREGRHPCWWRELTALYRSPISCDISAPEALQFALWQAMAFRLPLVQEEASGWWEGPHSCSPLHHQDFLPQINSPGSRDFLVTRQVETLALA